MTAGIDSVRFLSHPMYNKATKAAGGCSFLMKTGGVGPY